METLSASKAEHDHVLWAKQTFGDAVENTEQLIALFGELMTHVPAQIWLVRLFHGATLNSLCLALLSALRKHDVQTHLGLRSALENAVLACYAAYFPDDRQYARLKEEGSVEQRQELNTKAYRWLAEQSPTYDKRIKKQKRLINQKFAHGGLASAVTGVLGPHGGGHWFFDNHTDSVVQQRTLWVGNTAAALTDMVYKLLSGNAALVLPPDTLSSLARLFAINEGLRLEVEAIMTATPAPG